MRILSTTIILLFTIHTIKSSEDAGFAIKEVSNEISNVPQFAKNSFLEHELLNGKMTPMDLMEKILGRKVDQNGLDEYSKMDISNGIKEQNELMDLFEKSKHSETSDKDKKDIGDGIDQMERIKALNSVIDTVKNEVTISLQDVHDIKKAVTTKVDIPDNTLQKMVSKTLQSLRGAEIKLYNFEKLVPRDKPLPSEQNKLDDIKSEGHVLMKYLIVAKRFVDEVLDYIDSKYHFIKMTSFDSVGLLIQNIEKLSGEVAKMKSLNSLIGLLPKIAAELDILKKLRDDPTGRDVTNMMKKLEKDYDLTIGFTMPEDVTERYQKIPTVSKFSEKLTNFIAHMNRVDLTSSASIEQWKPLKDHLDNLKIPSGTLTEMFTSLKTCLESYDFAIDFTKHHSELKRLDGLFRTSIIEALKEYRDVHLIFEEAKKLKHIDDFPKIWNTNNEIGLEEALKQTVWSTYPISLTFFLKRFDVFEKVSPIDRSIYEAHKKLQNLPRGKLDELEAVLNGISSLIVEIEKFLKCYSGLNVVPSDIKSLIDIPQKVWNFNPKQMENTVELVDSLKEANEIMNELKNWKFDNNPLFDEFPLNSEDVQGILNGFESLKSIENIQNNWHKMTNLDYSQIEKSNIKNVWNEMVTSLESFIEQLSQMETHSKLSDIQLLISKIQFPSDIQIDLIIDFINIKYQGNDRNGILNILEDVKNLQNNFSSYSSKLQKMNESIEKLKKWMKEPVDKDEELKTDCFENPSCSELVTLPEATPESPV